MRTSKILFFVLALIVTVSVAATSGTKNKEDPASSLAGPIKPHEVKASPKPKAEKIPLPKPDYRGKSVEEAIKTRRSVRHYSTEPLTMKQLSQLVFAAQGITGTGHGRAFRSAPSAGALYPIELYVVVNNVKTLPPGIYHYSVSDHALEQIKAGNFGEQLATAGLEQKPLSKASVVFVLSAVVERTRVKYGARSWRYVYIEAGHISQNIYLQSASLGLGSVAMGAFSDEDMNRLIGVDGKKETAVYLHAVGKLGPKLISIETNILLDL